MSPGRRLHGEHGARGAGEGGRGGGAAAARPRRLRGLPGPVGGAVSHRVRWEPQDRAESQREQPSLDHQIARKRAAEVVTQVTRTLHQAVGGEIADEAEFLVDPEDL